MVVGTLEDQCTSLLTRAPHEAQTSVGGGIKARERGACLAWRNSIQLGARLAAIVAADLVGYSRLMGLDEVGTARTLREHRKATDALVAKHCGRIVKTTGDGVLLEFPSVADAVECAVSVQAVIAQRNKRIPQERRMLFRIGINLGDILIEGSDILGDGVNVAARLEAIAEPGGICISSSAYDQIRGKVSVEFIDLGEQMLKNIARPIRAYGFAGTANARRTAPLPSSTPRLSMVVLPFANLGGEVEQDYFADGVTESLTTDLSRITGALIIARNTAFPQLQRAFVSMPRYALRTARFPVRKPAANKIKDPLSRHVGRSGNGQGTKPLSVRRCGRELSQYGGWRTSCLKMRRCQTSHQTGAIA